MFSSGYLWRADEQGRKTDLIEQKSEIPSHLDQKVDVPVRQLLHLHMSGVQFRAATNSRLIND